MDPFDGCRNAAPHIDERCIEIAGIVAVRRYRAFNQADAFGQRSPYGEVTRECEQPERLVAVVSLPFDGVYCGDRFRRRFVDRLRLHGESIGLQEPRYTTINAKSISR